MEGWKRPPQVDVPSLFVVMLTTAAVLSLAGHGTVFACVDKLELEDNLKPSFGNSESELILSVPEDANSSYVIATLKAHGNDVGSNATIQWSLTNDNSEAFSVVSGKLQVTKRDILQGQHVLKLTVVAADENRTCNNSYLDVKIIVVDDVNDFVLSIPLPAAILRQNSQYVIQELGNILGLRLISVKNEKYANYDFGDSERSYIVFQAFEIDTNDTVRVNASYIRMKIAEEYERVASLFRFLASFLKSTSDSNDSEFSLNTLSKILVGVACLLFLIILAVVIIACRSRERCCGQDDSCLETLGCCRQDDPWSERFCCSRNRASLTDEAPLSQTNWSFNMDTEKDSVPAFEFPEHTEPSELSQTLTSQSEKRSMFEVRKDSERSSMFEMRKDSERSSMFEMRKDSERPSMFGVRKDTLSMKGETWSLGLNTVARREHSLDKQMQKLQELFQALGDDPPPSDDALYPKLDNDQHQGELQSSRSDKQNTILSGQRSTASEPAKSRVAVTESSGTDISKETQNSGSSKTQLIPRITLDEDGTQDFATSQQPDGIQQENTLMLHPAIAGLVSPQKSTSDISNEQPSFKESNTSRTSGFIPQKSSSDVSNQNSSFKESNESQIPSSLSQDSEDGHISTSFGRSDQNTNIQLPNAAKSQIDKPRYEVLQNTNRNMPLESSTTSRTPSSFTQDRGHGQMTPIYRTDGDLPQPHRVRSAPAKLTHPVRSAPVELTHPVRSAPVELTHPVRSEADKMPHPVMSERDTIPHPMMSAAVKLPHPVRSEANKLSHPVMPAPDKLQHPVMPVPSKLQHPLMPAPDKLSHPMIPAPDKLPHPVMSEADKLPHPVVPAAVESGHAAPGNTDRVVQEKQWEDKTNKPDLLFPTNTRSLDPPRGLPHDEDVEDSPANEDVGDSAANEDVGDSPANEDVGDSPADEDVGDSPADEDVRDSPADEDVGDSPANEDVGDSPANEDVEDSHANEDVGDSPADEDVGDILANEDVGDSPANEGVEDSPADEGGDIRANEDAEESPADEDAVTHF